MLSIENKKKITIDLIFKSFVFVFNFDFFLFFLLNNDLSLNDDDCDDWFGIISGLLCLFDCNLTSVHNGTRDEEMICYDNFGCFRDEGPFDYLDTLPASPDFINTTFVLYNRKTAQNGHTLDYQNISTLTSAPFLESKPVKVVIHGFGSSGRRPWVLQMTEALLYTVTSSSFLSLRFFQIELIFF